MEKVSEGLREAMDRYYRIQEVAFRGRGPKGPAEQVREPNPAGVLVEPVLECVESLLLLVAHLLRGVH